MFIVENDLHNVDTDKDITCFGSEYIYIHPIMKTLLI